jgi:hypothetical protein
MANLILAIPTGMEEYLVHVGFAVYRIFRIEKGVYRE